MLDFDGAACMPMWLRLPVADLSPLDTSLTDIAFAMWQNTIDTRCVQLLKPFWYLSVSFSFTIFLKMFLSSLPIICEKSVTFAAIRGSFWVLRLKYTLSFLTNLVFHVFFVLFWTGLIPKPSKSDFTTYDCSPS